MSEKLPGSEQWTVEDVELRHEFERQMMGAPYEQEWYERFYRKMKECCETAFNHGRLQGQEGTYDFFSNGGNLRLAAPLFSEWQQSDDYKKLMEG